MHGRIELAVRQVQPLPIDPIIEMPAAASFGLEEVTAENVLNDQRGYAALAAPDCPTASGSTF